MKPPVSPADAKIAAAAERDERLRHLSEPARAAFIQFQSDGNPTTLDPVIFAILTDYIPQNPAVPMAQMPGSTTLIEELGFDSLALTEVVFFTEDLFGIKISNDEIVQVRTLDDLRRFIHQKVAPGRAS